MALITEDGTGLATAESYCSVADADAYHVKMNTAATSWSDLTSTVKEAALRRATQYVDGRYRFQGERVKIDQALAWPRYNVWHDGYETPSNAVPLQVRSAVAELAVRAAVEDLLADSAAGGVVKSESVTVGEIAKSKTYIGGKTTIKARPIIDAMLKHFLSSGAEVWRA